MKDEIGRICGELDFPAEGRQAMLDAWDAVSGCPEAADCFEKWIAAYGEDIHIDYKAALLEADEAAKRAGADYAVDVYPHGGDAPFSVFCRASEKTI